MLLTLIAFGFFAADSSGGGGDIVAPAARTVIVPAEGAARLAWSLALDPSDRAPYAIDWSALLGSDEQIAEIVRVTLPARAEALGVQIDEAEDRAPTIGGDGKVVQLWLLVDGETQEDAAFAGAGLAVKVSVLVRTDAEPFKDFERSAVLIVRQQ